MVKTARKAVRQKLENLLFVQAAVERLPSELTGLADEITINYPWGSLLKALTDPDIEILSSIARLGKVGATLTMLINMSVFDDPIYCAKLGLSCPPIFADTDKTKALFSQAGIEVIKIMPEITDIPYRTTWGQKLTKGARRRILHLEAVIGKR